MFETSEQFLEFSFCCFSGIICGIFYELFYLLKLIFKKNYIIKILDVLFFSLSAIVCRFIFFYYNLSNFRFFYIIGVFLGLVIYLNSFHNIIAFLIKLVYNKICNFIKGLFLNVGAKKKKGIIGGSIGLNNVNLRVYNDTRIPNDNHFRKEKSNR